MTFKEVESMNEDVWTEVDQKQCNVFAPLRRKYERLRSKARVNKNRVNKYKPRSTRKDISKIHPNNGN
jgi:hypothetical protein